MHDDKIPIGMKGKEFKRYENHVQSCTARLLRTINKLHDEGHMDRVALQKISKLAEDL